MQIKQLNSKINSLKEMFDDLTEEIDRNNYRTLEYAELENKSVYDTEYYLEQYQKTNDDINIIVTDMIDLFGNNNLTPQNKVHCEFNNHCDYCTKRDDVMYCFNDCIDCILFRKIKEKERIEEKTKYYAEKISTKPKKKQENKSKTTISETSIPKIDNNLTIDNNVVKNYIQTKDWFFHVIITTNENNAEEKLKYIFTYLMCGYSSIKLFPNEPKFSKATSYKVNAAKYSIIENNKEPKYILNGILRYQYNNKASMNIKRLEKMGDDKYTVKVNVPNIWNNNKSQILKNDIDRFINIIGDSNNGSDVNMFYIEN